MRSDVWSVITSIIGIVALAVLTPALADELETCDGSPSTVFVTLPGVSVITIHDAPTTTVYVTSPSYAVVEVGELPTTTVTRYYTTTHTTTTYTALATLENDPTAKIVYETTITETAIVNTVYETVSSLLTQVNPLSFVVLGGSTSWIGGIAPASTESYVIVTNAITVVPINTPEPSSNMDHTSTTTILTTVVNSHPYTVTMTLPPQIITATVLPAGTGIPYTGVAPGGWNASSGFGNGVSVTKPSSGNPVFVTAEPNYDLYLTRSPESLTASEAKSGFAALSTDAFSSSSTFDETRTTAVGFSVAEITVLPYSNSTSSVTSSTSTSSPDLITPPTSSTFVTITYMTMDHIAASSVISAKSVDSAGTSSPSSFSGYLNSSSIQLTSTTSADSIMRFYTSSLGSYSNNLLTNATHSFSLSSIVTPTATAASASNSFLAIDSIVSSLEDTTTTGVGSSSKSFFSSMPKSSVLSYITTTLVYSAAVPSNFVKASNSDALRISMSLSSQSSSYALGYAAGFPSSDLGPSSGGTIQGTVSVPSSFSTIYTSLPESATSVTVSSSNLTTLLSSIAFSSAPSDSLLGFSHSSTTISSQTFAFSSSSASATPTTCGEVGDFTLNFDDIPPLVATNDTMDTVQPAPLFNPYHQFHFSNGFTVVPPPRDPYFPSSKPLLTEFIPNFTINRTNTESGPNNQQLGYSGDIGNGDHGLIGCFGFNFYGASFGCDSRGPDCDFTFTGFRYDPATQQTNQVAQQDSVVPACPPLQDCSLVPVIFTNEFMDLDSIRINVTVVGNPKIWWMDDLQLGWFNNTCAAGLCRINAHIH